MKMDAWCCSNALDIPWINPPLLCFSCWPYRSWISKCHLLLAASLLTVVHSPSYSVCTACCFLFLNPSLALLDCWLWTAAAYFSPTGLALAAHLPRRDLLFMQQSGRSLLPAWMKKLDVMKATGLFDVVWRGAGPWWRLGSSMLQLLKFLLQRVDSKPVVCTLGCPWGYWIRPVSF